MSFLKKTWLARIGVGLNRFRMNNSTDVVLESNPVSVTQQGDQLSADNMNNLETRIDNAFTEMAGNLATIEVSPSQHNWTVGSQIVYNGILYKVTSAISTDDNLVVGTNISPYPVSSAISDISAMVNSLLIPLDYSQVTINSDLIGTVEFVDSGANFAFKIGNYYVYHFNINVNSTPIYDNGDVLYFPYLPAGNTRVSINSENGHTGAPYIRSSNGALNTGRNGLWKTGHFNILAIYKGA